MPKFIPYNYDQISMVLVDFREQIQPGTFEYALSHLIDNKLDISVFHPRFKNDEGGRPAYDPAILLKIVLFAYSKGITSSREIQWCCETNIIFKALSCDTVPHFTTIADFISGRQKDIEELFEQIVLTCYEQGLLGNELLAIDGCKMSSNAAKTHSGTIKELEAKREKIKRQIHYYLEEHKKQDQLASKDEKQIKRTRQTIDTLNKAFDKIDSFLKTSKPRMGQGKRPTEVKSNITDNESAKMRTSKGVQQGYNGIAAVDKKKQIITDAQAFGEGQEHHTLQPVIEKIKERYKRLGISENIFLDGVKLTADTGNACEDNMKYLHQNEIDAYIPDNKFRSRDPRFADQKKKYGKRPQNKKSVPKMIPSSEFLFDPVKRTCICPAGHSTWIKNEGKDRHGNHKLFFEGRLTKCRICRLKTRCMKNPDSANTRLGHGRQVSFIIESKRKPNYTDWMKHRVDSQKGKEIYGHRMSVVEPVFANIGFNKGLNRFSLRGKAKVDGQWKLFCMVHNIGKLAKYGKMAA